MDIKLGFEHSPRELVIDSPKTHEEISSYVEQALSDGAASLVFDDNQGQKYIVKASSVAYVQVGSAHQRQVGFAN